MTQIATESTPGSALRVVRSPREAHPLNKQLVEKMRTLRESSRRVKVETDGLKELYINELKDLYSAENQLLKALPKMATEEADRFGQD
jgi:hypothetical protein